MESHVGQKFEFGPLQTPQPHFQLIQFSNQPGSRSLLGTDATYATVLLSVKLWVQNLAVLNICKLF